MNKKVENFEVDSELYAMCQMLIFSGRLISGEAGWFLDNIKIESPVAEPVDPNEVDEFGFFGPRNENGCQKNVYVGELIRSLASSPDPVWRAIAKGAPEYILFFSKSFFPIPGKPVRKMMWWNRNRNFLISNNGHYVHELLEAFTYNVIPNHVCFTPGNFTNPDYQPEKRSKYTGRLMSAYQLYLQGIYDKLTSRELGLGG